MGGEIHKFITENADSLEIGTPSRGGTAKVYFDANNLDEAQKKIDNIMRLRTYAQNAMKDEEDINGINATDIGKN